MSTEVKTKEKASKSTTSLVEKAFNAVEALVKDYFDNIPKSKFTLEATSLSFDLSDSFPKMSTELKKLKVRANNAPKLLFKTTWNMNEEGALEVKLLSVHKNGEQEISSTIVEDAKKIEGALKDTIVQALKDSATVISDYHKSNGQKIANILSGEGATLEDIEGVWELPEAVYRNINALNNSLLKEMDNSFSHFKEAQENEKAKTKSMQFGTLCHMYAFEKAKYDDQVVVTEVLSRATNEGKKQDVIFGVIHAGKEITSPETHQNVVRAGENLHKHPIASALMKEAKFEQVYIWGQEVEVNGQIEKPVCKAKIDGVIVEPSKELAKVVAKYLKMFSEEEILNSSIVFELKTTDKANDLDFVKIYENFDYDIQGACYSLAVRTIHARPVIFLIIAVDNKAPFEVNVFPVNYADIEYGEEVLLNRLTRWVVHNANPDMWHGYSLVKTEFLQKRSFAQQKNIDRANRKVGTGEEEV